MITAVVICAILAGAAAIHWGIERYKDQKEIRERRERVEVMAYVEKRAGAEFDFASAAQQLGLSDDQLADHLWHLIQAKRIRVTSRPPWRKPIIISLHDKQMFFWIVTAVKDEERPGEAAKPPAGGSGED